MKRTQQMMRFVMLAAGLLVVLVGSSQQVNKTKKLVPGVSGLD